MIYFCAVFARIRCLRKSPQSLLVILPGNMAVSANFRDSPRNFQNIVQTHQHPEHQNAEICKMQNTSTIAQKQYCKMQTLISTSINFRKSREVPQSQVLAGFGGKQLLIMIWHPTLLKVIPSLSLSLYIYIYICIYIHTYVYIYIYIYVIQICVV